eukprot:CAMPEP_0197866476 /NCGR_PEP_ID=MMETSP1438-20131217/44231_1 /TAXON_ID=1461541 /ORGANISM="Pterosperma sp., Strain CCMP1384" /LENGTH=373 /DNA_ID=CAMNT_0043485047 /DNA_START=166 /DNA_END=1287 /DNA_ORIENTATION=+
MAEQQSSTAVFLWYFRFFIVTAVLTIILLSLLDVIPLMDTLGEDVVDMIRGMNAGGGVVYAFISAAFSIICVPSSLLSLSAGYIYENTVWGTLSCLPGVLLGATISFFMGRVLFKEAIEKEMHANESFKALTLAANHEGWKIVFLARLSPIPFGLLNYGFSVSKISYLHFILATILGMIPVVIVYAKVGSDFYTYFKTDDLKKLLVQCENVVTEANCPLAFSTSMNLLEREQEASKCVAEADECDKEGIKALAEDLQCAYNSCEVDKTFTELTEQEECIEFAVAKIVVPEKAEHGDCLQDLNNTELWPKIVFPACLVLTLVLIMIIVKKHLKKIAYLQLKAELDKQRDMLAAERTVMDEMEKQPRESHVVIQA